MLLASKFSQNIVFSVENTLKLSTKQVRNAILQIELLQKWCNCNFFRDVNISPFRIKSPGLLNENIHKLLVLQILG